MRYTLTIRQSHIEAVRDYFAHGDEAHRLAWLKCGISQNTADPWFNEPEERWISKELLFDRPIDPQVSDHLVCLCQEGKAAPQAADSGMCVYLSENGQLHGHRQMDEDHHASLECIRVIGDSYKFHVAFAAQTSDPILHRQRMAFGQALQRDLGQLRVAVIGAGATGSACALLLARLGIGHLYLVDGDAIETTNLHRLHGAGLDDVGTPKVHVIQREIERIGLGTRVAVSTEPVLSEASVQKLKSVEVIFGCTDDNLGRIILNRLAYTYTIPVIDMGVRIRLKDGHTPEITDLMGRVTVVQPGTRCLLCHEVINLEVARGESVRAQNEQLYQQLRAEAYVIGEDSPNPAIGTFTTEIATVAVNELLHRVQGYRGLQSVDHRLRLFNRDVDLFPAPAAPHCSICTEVHWHGHGDQQPLLGLVLA